MNENTYTIAELQTAARETHQGLTATSLPEIAAHADKNRIIAQRKLKNSWTLEELLVAMQELNFHPSWRQKIAAKLAGEDVESLPEGYWPGTTLFSEAQVRQALADSLSISGSGTVQTRGLYRSLTNFLNDVIRRLRETEETYEQGAVVRSATGELWQRKDDGWVQFGQAYVYGHAVPRRPLSRVQ